MTSVTYQLIMRSGPTPEKVFELTQPVIFIGREYSNEIVINDQEISRRHARLTAQTGGFVLDDMGSTNGTFVNGLRLLGPHLLRPGELITFGEKVSLSFEALQFDPNATVVSPVNLPPYQEPYSPAAPYGSPAAGQQQPAQVSPQPGPSYPSASQPGPIPRQTYTPPASLPSYYSGQIPESPEMYEQPEEKRRLSRTWLLLGVGCLLVFLCVCVGVALAFDTLNLYCVPPFGSLFNFLYTCP
jgi:predicted component of type VI protein secretion system